MNMDFDYMSYYQYLFYISWPLLLLLIIILLFLSFRLYSRFYRLFNGWKDLAKGLVLSLPVLIALLIYLNMFLVTYPDWLHMPAAAIGTVKNHHILKGGYYLDIQYGEEVERLKIDLKTFRELKKGNLIHFEYLTQKKEIYKCTVLSDEW